MLSSLLGVVVAFITVMLLLSLVVMTLVQLTQATLRLRARNLLVGITALLRSEGLASSSLAPQRSQLRRRESGQWAAEILNTTTPAKIRPVDEPNSWRNVIRGPATSWVDPRDVAHAVVRNLATAPAMQTLPDGPASLGSLTGMGPGHGPIAVIDDPLGPERYFADKFRALEPAMTDRFARTMQLWTSIWAIAVAIIFQVSTPALLTTLSTSEAKRDVVIAMVPSVLQQAESTIPAGTSDDFVDRALVQLAQSYPNHQDAFDQVSGSTDSREEMLQELRDVLTNVPEQDAMVTRYAQIIDSASTRDVQAALTTATGAMDSLDVLDIRPWGRGAIFYMSPANIVGVLLTAILLSFGAPFWFQQLRNVASLRDALSKERGAQGSTK